MTRLFAGEIASGTVTRLFPELEPPNPIRAVRPAGRRLTAKVRLFIEFMQEALAANLRS